jgi:hypothetical protein
MSPARAKSGLATPPKPSATMLPTAMVVRDTSLTLTQRPSTTHIKNAPRKNEMPIAGDKTSDNYLDYLSKETMKALDPYWKKAMVEGRDPAAYVQALERLGEDSDEREELIEKGWARARQFTWQKTAAMTAEVYKPLF